MVVKRCHVAYMSYNNNQKTEIHKIIANKQLELAGH